MYLVGIPRARERASERTHMEPIWRPCDAVTVSHHSNSIADIVQRSAQHKCKEKQQQHCPELEMVGKELTEQTAVQCDFSWALRCVRKK